MGLVDEHTRAELSTGVGDGPHRSHVTLHRVDAVDGDERALTAFLLPDLEPVPEARHRVVPEVPEGARRQAGAVDDAGVARDVNEGGVPRADEGRDHTQVDRVPGREHQAGLGPEPVAQLLLQLVVEGKGAVHQPAAGAPGAVLLDGVHRRPLHPLVARQAQVVVGPEHDHPASLVDHGRPSLAAHHLEEGDEAHGVGDLVLLKLGCVTLVEQVGHRKDPVGEW